MSYVIFDWKNSKAESRSSSITQICYNNFKPPETPSSRCNQTGVIAIILRTISIVGWISIIFFNYVCQHRDNARHTDKHIQFFVEFMSINITWFSSSHGHLQVAALFQKFTITNFRLFILCMKPDILLWCLRASNRGWQLARTLSTMTKK